MEKPKKKRATGLGLDLADKAHNKACEEYEKWLDSLPYFQDGDGDKYAMITDVQMGEGKKICLPSKEDIEEIRKKAHSCDNCIKAIFKRQGGK